MTLTKFGKRRKNWGVFFPHSAFFMSLSWCFRRCLVLLFLTVSVLLYFQADISISLVCKRPPFYSRSLYKFSLYRILAGNVEFRCLICINKNLDLPLWCSSICSFFFFPDVLFLCADIPSRGTSLWSLQYLVLVICRLQVLKWHNR